MSEALSNNLFDPLVDAFAEAVARKLAGCRINEPGDEAELLKPEELARRLKVPKTWVYEQSRQKKLPTVQVGRYKRFDLKAVLGYLAEQQKH